MTHNFQGLAVLVNIEITKKEWVPSRSVVQDERLMSCNMSLTCRLLKVQEGFRKLQLVDLVQSQGIFPSFVSLQTNSGD